MTNAASAPMGMRLKTIATLFAVSTVMLTGSPAFATQISRHDTRNQSIESCGAFDACSPRGIGAAFERRQYSARSLAEQHDPGIMPADRAVHAKMEAHSRLWGCSSAVESRKAPSRASISSDACCLN